MKCKYASFKSVGKYYCSVSGNECMYLIPDSKRCTEEYPDAQQNKCDGFIKEEFYGQ